MNNASQTRRNLKWFAILLILTAGATQSRATLLYAGDPGVTVTGLTVVESGYESVYNTGTATPFVSANNLTKILGTTSASSEIGGFESTMVQNGIYPTSDNSPDNPWLPTSNGTEYVQISLSSPITLSYLGFGTQFTNRSSGTYTLLYTTDNLNWNTLGTVQMASSGNVLGRNLFDAGDIANVSGIRISGVPDIGLGQASISVSEVEIYTVPEPSSLVLMAAPFAALLLTSRRRKTLPSDRLR